MKKVNRVVIVETRRVGYEGRYYLIVPDHASGRRNRYTVYQVPSSPSRRVKVVGRELPYLSAERVAEGRKTRSNPARYDWM
jgi:hypothetical protein